MPAKWPQGLRLLDGSGPWSEKPQQDDDALFIAKRLARVRKQLDRIDGMIEKETDPMKLDRLASAQARLSEQERILAGRPMPGSLRPKKPPERARPYWEVSRVEPLPTAPVRPLASSNVAPIAKAIPVLNPAA